MSWNRKKYSPIGLDIGQTAVRGVQLVRKGGRWHVYSAFQVPCQCCEGQGLGEGTPASEGAESSADSRLIDALKSLMEQGGFVGKKVVIHCPAEKQDMRPVVLPCGPGGLEPDLIESAIRLKLQGCLSFPMDQAVTSYFVQENRFHGTAEMSLMTITADGAWIDGRIREMQQAGLDCRKIEPVPIALSNVNQDYFLDADNVDEQKDPAEEKAGKDQAVSGGRSGQMLLATIDVGLSGSTLVVQNGKSALFCRRFSFGGQRMTNILTDRLLMENDQAEILKKQFGLNCGARQLRQSELGIQQSTGVLEAEREDEQLAQTLYAALEDELDSYVVALTRSLNYVISEQSGSRLDRIVLCGGGSLLGNLHGYLQEKLEVPVELIRHRLLGQIEEGFDLSSGRGGSWATALGLALSAEEYL